MEDGYNGFKAFCANVHAYSGYMPIFPVYHYFRSLCALVRVVFCVRLSICVLFHETLCFYHTISYYSSIQLLSCKCVFIKLLCVLFITVV